jgi:hypothetical protein
MSGTYEQYGAGPYVVRAFWDGGRGVYRFQTRQEAREKAGALREYDHMREVRISKSRTTEHGPLFPGNG